MTAPKNPQPNPVEKRITFMFNLSEEEAETLFGILKEATENVLADAKNHDEGDDRQWLMEYAASIARMRATIMTCSRYES